MRDPLRNVCSASNGQDKVLQHPDLAGSFDQFGVECLGLLHLFFAHCASIAITWSSYRAMIGEEPAPEWLETRTILAAFGETEPEAVAH